MFRRLFLALLPAFVFSVFTHSATHAQNAVIDTTDPAAVAQQFLTAFKAKNIERMVLMMSPKNMETFGDVATQGESHPLWKQIFGGWRYEAVRSWNGEMFPPRFPDPNTIVVPFAEAASGEVAVLVMLQNQGHWGVDDINSPSVADLEALPLSP